MTIGAGYSKKNDTSEALEEILGQASKGLGDQKASWALMFVADKHDAAKASEMLRAKVGDIPVVGGAAVGIIAPSFQAYGGFEMSLALFSEDLKPKGLHTAEIKDENDFAAGQDIGRYVNENAKDGDNILVLYDTLVSSPPPKLHVGTKILDGIYDQLKVENTEIIGGGLLSDLNLTRSFVYGNNQPLKHAVTCVILPERLGAKTQTMHGCEPAGSFKTVTKVEGPVIFEIDNRPAVEVILEAMDKEKNEESIASIRVAATLGRRFGDKYAEYSEQDYVSRLVVGANPEDGSVIMFEDDFEVGSEVQIMLRDADSMMESLEEGMESLIENVEKPALLFYVDCAGRTSAFSGSVDEEGDAFREAAPDDLPLAAFYSGVEFGAYGGRTRALDWTGVATLFYYKD